MSSAASSAQEAGVQSFQQKDYEAAIAQFEQARDAYLADDKPDMAAEMSVNIGLAQRALGQNQAAVESIQAALAVFTEMQDTRRQAMALGNLGGVYVAMNDKDQANEAYREAATLFDELGEKKMLGETLLAIAQLQMSERKIGSAAATYEAGLSELDDLSASQKMIRGLLGFRNRLLGGGVSASSSDDDAPTSN